MSCGKIKYPALHMPLNVPGDRLNGNPADCRVFLKPRSGLQCYQDRPEIRMLYP